MAAIDASRWPVLNALLDELLGLTPGARAERMAQLAGDDPPLARELQSLLALATVVEREGFLDGQAGLPPLTSGLLAGRAIGAYTLLAPLGEGGMGAVWLGERNDGRFAGKVAIKFPSLAMLASGGAQRFRREGEVLARLAHPHIARLLDAGLVEGRPYLVLEYVEGETIDRWCDARSLGIEARIRLFLDVLAAVAHAHGNLVLHRDVKPSNILVDREGSVKLLDFGIAKLLDEARTPAAVTELTHVAGRVFTPEYAAPEQRRAGPLTTATDVYALGVLLYMLLVGEPAAGRQAGESSPDAPARPSEHAGRTGSDTAARRGSTPPQLARALRGDLDNIIARALKHEPAERYPNAEAFADDLRRWLAHEPVSARADTLAYRASKFVRRHRFGVAVSALLAVAIAGGVAGTLTQGRRALAEAAAAKEARDHALQHLTLAEATSDFLAFLLGSTPAGRNLTVVELMDRAEHLAEQQYADNPALRARLLLDIGAQFAQIRDDQRGLATLHKAVAAANAQPDVGLRAIAECQLARMIGNRDLAEAAARVDAALRPLRVAGGGGDSDALLDCLVAAADIAVTRGDAARAEALAREALALPTLTRPGRRAQALDVREILGTAQAQAGRLADALRTREQAFAELTALGRARTLRSSSSLNNWGKVLSDAGAIRQAAEAYGQALEIIETVDPAGLDPAILGNRAKALAEIGQMDEALALFERALAAAERTGDDRALGFTRANAAYALCKAGQLEPCTRHLASARPALERALGPGHPVTALLDTIAGRVALAQGRNGDAAEHFERAFALYDASPTLNLRKVLALTGLAEARLAAGDAARARDAAQRAVDVASAPRNGLGFSYWLGEALLARGRVALAQGDIEPGRESLRMAIGQLVPAVGEQAPATLEARARLATLKVTP